MYEQDRSQVFIVQGPDGANMNVSKNYSAKFLLILFNFKVTRKVLQNFKVEFQNALGGRLTLFSRLQRMKRA